MSSVFDALQLQRIAQAIEDGQAGATATATVNLDFSNVGDMTGATAGTAGTHGLVPAPAAGDQDKTLHGDGSWRVDSADLPQVFGSSSGSVITLTDAADYVASDLVINIEPVQSGSGDPSPDNIRPISGWTECNVTRIGKNIVHLKDATGVTNGTYRTLTVSNELVSVSATGSVASNSIVNMSAMREVCENRDLPPGTYSFSVANLDTNNSAVTLSSIRLALTDDTLINNGESFTLTSAKKIGYITNSAQITYNANTYIKFNLQIERSAQVSEYEQYTGTTYTITFTDGADPLTVYGGTLDVVNGTLTVTKANIASYAGETLPGAWISDRDVYDPDNPTTPTTGAQVVYDLDTPFTYQVISTDVYLTSGTCNVWADTGDIITLEYVKADYNDLMQAVQKMKMPDYSTSEQDTGLKWIDGKSIYQKTINFTVAGGGYISNPTGITGIETLIKHEGVGRITDYVIDETAYNNPPTNAYSIAIIYFFQNGELLADYRATEEAVGADFYITLWYTKF